MSLASFIRVQKYDKSGSPVLNSEGKPLEGWVVNPIKPHVKGYWLNDVKQVQIVLTPGGIGQFQFLIDNQGHFDWAYILGESTGAYLLNFFDPGTNRSLMNKPVHSSLCVGGAQRPFRLPEPYFFNVGDSQRQLICYIQDISGETNTVTLTLYGRRFYHKEAPPQVAEDIMRKMGQGSRTYSYFIVPQEYSQQGIATPLAPFASTTFTLQSDASADTEIQKFLAVSTGDFTVRIREQDTDRYLSNDILDMNETFGNAEFPFLPADTYLLERLKYLLVEVTDVSGSPNTIYMAAAGRRLELIH
jgi:hypothetical protein